MNGKFLRKTCSLMVQAIKETSCVGSYSERCSQTGFFVDFAEIQCTSSKFFWTHSKATSNRKTISQLINTYEQTCIFVCVYIRIFVRAYTYAYTHIRVCLYAHMPILIHTYAHTYTHMRIYLYACYAHFLVNVYLSGTVWHHHFPHLHNSKT